MSGKRYFIGFNVIFLISLMTCSTIIYMMSDPTGAQYTLGDISSEPIVPSNPGNVVIKEIVEYFAPNSENENIMRTQGVMYFEELSGTRLQMYFNTSKVIEVDIQDYNTGEEYTFRDSCGSNLNCVETKQDRYVIIPGGDAFEYNIKTYYEPDLVEDTGFYVIFNSQTVDFSVETYEGELVENTDYYSKIILPKGAGIVSLAPLDDGEMNYIQLAPDHYGAEWQFINQNMHPYYDPVMISITYKYDQIYLGFTEENYQKQMEEQRRQEEINKLNAIQSSFKFISLLSFGFSIIATLSAYLLARKKYHGSLQQAKELPRISTLDIEEVEGHKMKSSSLFSDN